MVVAASDRSATPATVPASLPSGRIEVLRSALLTVAVLTAAWLPALGVLAATACIVLCLTHPPQGRLASRAVPIVATLALLVAGWALVASDLTSSVG